MAGQKCQNCKKGFLINTGKRTKIRCTHCGYWKFRSPNEASRGSKIGAIPIEKPEIHPEMKEEYPKEEETIPSIPEEPEKLYQKDPDYIRKKALNEQQAEGWRREASIQRILQKLRKQGKYSGLGDTIIIDGETWDIKTGERIGGVSPGIEAEQVE